MLKAHLDTDLGGDLDDLCALALLLRWSPTVEITGITVVGDTNGKRTGMVRYVLDLVGRSDIPVAAGADTAQGYYPYALGLPPEERYWPTPIPPSPNPPQDAVALLRQSIDAGARLITIGPLTNLYLLDLAHPGVLARADLYVMGGYIYPPRPGYPAWHNEDDFNMQVDIRSARHVFARTRPTLIPLTVTAETALRHAHLAALRDTGDALGQLIARQAAAFAADEQMAARYGATCANVPQDIINFHHDPLAVAVALGWRDRVKIEEIPLMLTGEADKFALHIDAHAPRLRVVTQIDGAHFSDFWLKVVTGV